MVANPADRFLRHMAHMQMFHNKLKCKEIQARDNINKMQILQNILFLSRPKFRNGTMLFCETLIAD